MKVVSIIMSNNCIKVDYTEVSNLNIDYLSQGGLAIDLYLDKTNETTFLTSLFVRDKELVHIQTYMSPTEFATISMKETLILHVKRRVVSLYPDYYTKDDPKLHGFISKLSYEGIKYVAEHVVEFAKAFKENKTSDLLSIPNNRKKFIKKS